MAAGQTCLRSASVVAKARWPGMQAVDGPGAPEGWSTVAVVATCRPLLGPDGLAASSLPFLARETAAAHGPLRAHTRSNAAYRVLRCSPHGGNSR
jgi:hypothetical protein